MSIEPRCPVCGKVSCEGKYMPHECQWHSWASRPAESSTEETYRLCTNPPVDLRSLSEKQFIDSLRTKARGCAGVGDHDLMNYLSEAAARLEDCRSLKPECFDCGLSYTSPGWVDVVIPDDDWKKIAPTRGGNGLLCFHCMNARLSRLGLAGVRATIKSGAMKDTR